MNNDYSIALIGNPNCGKTTLFNALTGSTQRVGNWPGVTVEQKSGNFKLDNKKIEIVDLPGIYSLSTFSLDEKVSREYLLSGKSDLVVNILDATNMERNLYLTSQMIEMKIPLIVVLNMMDVAASRKIKIEIDHLAKHLGCQVISMVANKKKGIEELKNNIGELLKDIKIPTSAVEYDSMIEEAIKELIPIAEPYAEEKNIDARWLSIKLLEDDEFAKEITKDALIDKVNEAREKVEKHIGEEIDITIADGKYGFINGLVKDVVHRENQLRRTVSDNIDKIALNRIFGIPLFLVVMYLIFVITINVGTPFIDFFDVLCGTIFVDGFAALLNSFNTPLWLTTLLSEGIGGGIQTVATFIPPVFFMFLCLSVLEDSGYMSRAAFVMDRFMRFIGLPGKSFIPMLVGFGCTVPAVMATRTLENSKDRFLTLMMAPFMSCSARLPVYVLFASVFFAGNAGKLIFSIYVVGIVLAMFTGLLMKKTLLKGEVSTFVMELPPYHIPTLNGIFFHTWERLKVFIKRAGKAILLIVVILSFLNSIGTDGSFGNSDGENSILSKIGKTITPVFSPMGIQKENWPATVGLFTGIFAKEAVVGTLDALYTNLEKADGEEEDFDFWAGVEESFVVLGVGFKDIGSNFKDPIGVSGEKDEESVAEEFEVKSGTFRKMESLFGSKSAAYAYLLFILIYLPCVAVIATIYRETNLKWTIFVASYLTILAWIVSSIFFQTANFFAHPLSSFLWIVSLLVVIVVFYFILKKIKIKL